MTHSNRRYVVTGAASGIGLATTRQLQSAGALVIGVDLSDADICVDLSTPAGRLDMVDAVASITDQLDGVVACAGVTTEAAVQVNFFGSVATFEGMRPLLTRGSDPRAVAISSCAALHLIQDGVVHVTPVIEACLLGDETAAIAAGGGADYPGSKCALCMWVRQHAPRSEWVGSGILLNCVAPGVIRTPMTEPLLATEEGRQIMSEFVPMPMGGPGEPEAMAHLLSWLVSSDNKILAGQVIFADGGSECVMRGESHF